MKPLRVAVCGSGNRSRTAWQRLANAREDLELVGVHDVSPDSLTKAVELGLVSSDRTYGDLEAMLSATTPDLLIACPVIAAHTLTVEAGIRHGCHVLVEKPFTDSLADAIRLVDQAEERGVALGVVQNWRAKSMGDRLHAAVRDGLVGDVSHIFFRYLRDREHPHLPDYLFVEEDPLLYAMSIHHVDLFRYVLGQEIVRVTAHSARPAWSRYRTQSILQAWLETEGGVVISYTGTFSSRNGHLPQESLQVEGELGTLSNESAYGEPPLLFSRRGDAEPTDLTAEIEIRDSEGQNDIADRRILENFVAAIQSDSPLLSSGRENLGTLAVIEAVAVSWREQRAVNPQELIAEARKVKVETRA